MFSHRSCNGGVGVAQPADRNTGKGIEAIVSLHPQPDTLTLYQGRGLDP